MYVLGVPYSCGVVLVFLVLAEIVFGAMYVLSEQYSCAVVSVFLLWRKSKISTVNTLLLYSLSPYSQSERQTEKQIHSLCVGWRNLFSSCAVVSVFCSGGK
jgi:hypothetical protein